MAHSEELKGRPRDLDPCFLKKLDILDAQEAAAYLRLSYSTLAKMRMTADGPQFIRQSARKVLYRRTALDAWLDARARGSTYQGAA